MSFSPDKKLIDKWYAKLKAEGFNDIERMDVEGSQGTLKVWSHTQFSKYATRPEEFRAKQEYYVLAGRFLYDHKFADEKEKLIWELHSKGLGCIAIETAMKKRRFKVYRDLINRTIMRLRARMLDDAR